MKLTYIFFLTAFLQIHANVYSQKVKISMSVKETRVEDVLEKIEQLTEFTFIYNVKNIDLNRKISINAKNEKLEKVLSKIFGNTSVDFIILKKQIALRTKRNIDTLIGPQTKNRKPRSVSSLDENIQQTTTQQTISGTVTDEKGIPLLGVSVYSDKTLVGVTTNYDGIYNISIAKGEVLLFDYIGYKTKSVTIGDALIYNVQMELSTIVLESVDIISTGYQKLPVERTTGSFQQVKERVLDNKINQNAISKLEGETTGVLFNDTSSDGTPSIIVRGFSSVQANTEPLIVVDGFPIEGSLRTINPNDIESISVLKDAAAASVWGIRSSNGVIVVVTKKGNYNNKLKVNFSVNTAITQKTNLYKLPIASTTTQLAYQREILEKWQLIDPSRLFSGTLNSNTLRQIDPLEEILSLQQRGDISQETANNRISLLGGNDIRDEYSKLLLRDKIWSQYNFSLSGGGENYTFRGSMSYNKNEEEIIGTGSEQILLNLINDFDITERLKLSTNFNYSQRREDMAPSGFAVVGGIRRGLSARNLLSSYPLYNRILDDSGNYLPQVGGINPQSSQLALNSGFLYPWTYNIKQEIDNADNKSEDTAVRIQTNLDYKIFDDLRLSLGYQTQWGQNNTRLFYNENTFVVRDGVNSYTQFQNGAATSYPIPAGGILDLRYQNSRSFTARGQLNYDADFKEGLHKITAIGGYEVRKTIGEISEDIRYGYDNQSLTSQSPDFTTLYTSPLIFSSPTRIPDRPGLNFNENRFVSYYLNGAYTYNYRYTLSASVRLDDTNLFGASKEYRNVPLYSFGAKWNVAKDFLQGNKTINALNLTATYGVNGNVDLTTSPLLQVGFSRNRRPFTNPSSFISSVPNPELRLEKTKILNLGLSYGLFNNRVSGSFEYYLSKSEDLLVNQSLNSTSGIEQLFTNVGDLTNEGIEASLSITVVDTEDFNYTSSGNFSFNKNTLTKVDDRSFNTSDYIFGEALIVGRPLSTIHSFNYAGLDKTGAPQYIDKDGEVVDFRTNVGVDPSALLEEGTTIPKYYGAWINEFNYNGLSLRLLTTFKGGHVFRNTDSFWDPSARATNVSSDYNQRWQNPGDELITDIPAFPNAVDAFSEGYTNYTNTDKFVESATHIRLSQASLSYNFGLQKEAGFNNIRLGVQADNIAVWSFNKWKVDPENPDYPLPSTLTLNVSLTF